MKKQPLKRDPKKTRFFFEKSDVPATCPVSGFGSQSAPKRHPKIMKKSTPKKYPKMMPKGRKGMQNAPKIAPEILENPFKNQCRKGIEKTLKKR